MRFASSFRVWGSVPILLAWLFSVLPVSRADQPDASDGIVIVEFAGTHADIREQLVFSIEQRGLAVSNVAPVGEMLSRTRADFGVARDVYGSAEIVQFCSARTAHAAARVDPRLLLICPYSIAVYTLADTPGRVYVGYRQPALPGLGASADAVLAQARTLLEEIVGGISP